MQHSPTHEHYEYMFVFIVNQIVGPELAPPVYVRSSLPVLYVLPVTYCHFMKVERLYQKNFAARQ